MRSNTFDTRKKYRSKYFSVIIQIERNCRIQSEKKKNITMNQNKPDYHLANVS